MASSIKVKGLREFQRACNKSSKEVRTGLRRRLETAGRIVSDDARQRFSGIDARSAGSMRPRVRGGGIVVAEQRRRRTTGQHPQFGSLQMRTAFLPALASKRGEVEREFEQMLDDIVDGF